MWGMAPSEFWAMHPRHFHWLIEAKRPRKMYGSMTEDEVEALYAETYGEDGE